MYYVYVNVKYTICVFFVCENVIFIIYNKLKINIIEIKLSSKKYLLHND